jgi:hypothetical protein
MPITFTIDDTLADQLKPYEAELPRILALGIREWQARGGSGYNGLNSVLEQLAALPSPEEVLALRPSPRLQQRIDDLLEQSQSKGLSAEDQLEWEQYRYVEHLVRLAKLNAARKLDI